MDQVLRQGNLRAVLFLAGDFDHGRVEILPAQMGGAAVGENRQRRARAEDLQAGGQRGEPHRFARFGQAAADGGVAVLVSPLVEVMAELALRGKLIDERLLHQQILARPQFHTRDDHPVVEERVEQGVIHLRPALRRVAQDPLRPQHHLVLARADRHHLARGQFGGQPITVNLNIGRAAGADDLLPLRTPRAARQSRRSFSGRDKRKSAR